ncbi:unnamed protein product [Gadus morhua 'NCC']
MQDTDIGTRREIALKCLIINMRESMDDLVQEFLVSEKEEAEHILQGATMAIYIIRDAQAAPKDIGIILEGQETVEEMYVNQDIPENSEEEENVHVNGNVKQSRWKHKEEDCIVKHEGADITLISYMLQAAEAGSPTIRILSDDTDVFVMLVYWAWKANVQSTVQMEKWNGTILDKMPPSEDWVTDVKVSWGCMRCRDVTLAPIPVARARHLR